MFSIRIGRAVARRRGTRTYALPEDPFVVLKAKRGQTRAEVRKLYLNQIKELHPDVNPDRDTTEEAARVNRAYEKILTMFEKGELNPEGGEKDERSDVFDRSEGEASSIFINPFSTPGMDPLEWKLLQELVRDAEDGSVDPEDVLRRAGVSVRAGAVHYLTQEQLAAVVEELEARHSRKPPGFPKRRRNGSHNTDDTLIDDFTL